ncbi:hypothetical protein BVX98_05685 [bacterium F11]|nr:hypothetical protein BVX98_05685 [bacterium F11]
MRHAEPLRPTEWDGPDSTRPLSERGVEGLNSALQQMKDKGFSFQRVLSSPLARAKQTAEMMAQNGDGIPVNPQNELTAGVKPSKIREFLLNQNSVHSVLLVGHMPDLALFAGSVVPDAKLMASGIRPGEIWAIETGDMGRGWGTGKLLWQRTLDDWKKL